MLNFLYRTAMLSGGNPTSFNPFSPLRAGLENRMSIKKLSLSKETLVALDGELVQNIVGGNITNVGASNCANCSQPDGPCNATVYNCPPPATQYACPPPVSQKGCTHVHTCALSDPIHC